jgi:hypothetical protein
MWLNLLKKIPKGKPLKKTLANTECTQPAFLEKKPTL